MFEQVVQKPPQVNGYRLIERQQIPIRRVSLIGLISVPAWFGLFVGLAYLFGGSPHIRLYITFWGVVFAVANLTFIMPAAHEAIHGLVARVFGARPKFGVGAGFAYTTFREPVRPVPYLVIGLAPLLLISLAGIALLVFRPVAPGQTLVFIIGNAAGAVGDLWVAVKVLRLPEGSLVCDLADGFAYYLPEHGSSID